MQGDDQRLEIALGEAVHLVEDQREAGAVLLRSLTDRQEQIAEIIGEIPGVGETRDRIALSDEPLLASVVNLAEALAGPGAERREAHLRDVAGIEPVEVPAEAAQRLGGLRRETKLKMPDCVALELAERGGHRLATFDRRLGAAAAARGLSILG